MPGTDPGTVPGTVPGTRRLRRVSDDCLFCQIVAGELPSIRVHEDERAIAIMDIYPATRGHVLVIPRAHADDIHSASDEDVAHCAQVAKRLAGRAMGRARAPTA